MPAIREVIAISNMIWIQISMGIWIHVSVGELDAYQKLYEDILGLD